MESNQSLPREGYIQNGNIRLFYRDIGKGEPLIIIHGGPEFDHTYLLPDMDRLTDDYRLIYYDQRGRGKSHGELMPDDISIGKYIEELECIRKFLQVSSIAVLGHSWGGHVAMQYALHHPKCVSHMILLNTAPASYEDAIAMMKGILNTRSAYEEQLQARAAGKEYKDGDPETVAGFFMTVYGTTFKNPEHLKRLNLRFTKEEVLRGRLVEKKVMEGLYETKGFTIIPALKQLRSPTLIIHGSNDFIPVECSTHIAEVIPGAHLKIIEGSGHFSYIDAPGEVRSAINKFFNTARYILRVIHFFTAGN